MGGPAVTPFIHPLVCSRRTYPAPGGPALALRSAFTGKAWPFAADVGGVAGHARTRRGGACPLAALDGRAEGLDDSPPSPLQAEDEPDLARLLERLRHLPGGCTTARRRCAWRHALGVEMQEPDRLASAMASTTAVEPHRSPSSCAQKGGLGDGEKPERGPSPGSCKGRSEGSGDDSRGEEDDGQHISTIVAEPHTQAQAARPGGVQTIAIGTQTPICTPRCTAARRVGSAQRVSHGPMRRSTSARRKSHSVADPTGGSAGRTKGPHGAGPLPPQLGQHPPKQLEAASASKAVPAPASTSGPLPRPALPRGAPSRPAHGRGCAGRNDGTAVSGAGGAACAGLRKATSSTQLQARAVGTGQKKTRPGRTALPSRGNRGRRSHPRSSQSLPRRPLPPDYLWSLRPTTEAAVQGQESAVEVPAPRHPAEPAVDAAVAMMADPAPTSHSSDACLDCATLQLERLVEETHRALVLDGLVRERETGWPASTNAMTPPAIPSLDAVDSALEELQRGLLEIDSALSRPSGTCGAPHVV
mmetsp:Transcript_105317/g.296503  ORF Transcript_105317/g.296503 Transcript_105317/m.296503 type:complete len:530 (+) Transcript_105317:50-1639(+)